MIALIWNRTTTPSSPTLLSVTEFWEPTSSRVAIATIVLPSILGFLTVRFIRQYQRWLRRGRGGLPYNIIGYLTNLLITVLLAKSETKLLLLYDQPKMFAPSWNAASDEEKAKAQRSHLKEPLAERNGPEANAIHYCAPQREKNVDEYFDPEVKKVSCG